MGDLTEALVGGHTSLYATNAYFRQHIDMLARLIPLWVDALAASAVDEQARYEQAVMLARRSATGTAHFIVDGEGTRPWIGGAHAERTMSTQPAGGTDE